MQCYQLIDELRQNFIQTRDDGYIPLMMSGFDLLNGRLTDDSLPDGTQFHNFFAYALHDTSQRLTVLEEPVYKLVLYSDASTQRRLNRVRKYAQAIFETVGGFQLRVTSDILSFPRCKNIRTR